MINQTKLFLFFSSFFLTFSATAQYTDVINSNRPGESQSAFSVGKSVIQVESGVYGTLEEHELLGTKTNGLGVDFVIRYGAFFEELELNMEVKHQWDQFKTALGIADRSDFRRVTIGAKYLLYDPHKYYEEKVNIRSWKANQKFKWRQFTPAVAVFAGANLNFNSIYLPENDSQITPKIMLITQNQFSGGFVFVTNIIADRIASDFPSYGYIITLTKSFSPKWSGFVENQGFKSDFYSDSILRTGAAFLVTDDLQIDASVGGSFKDTPSIFSGGIGLSWRFDKNYKPVMLRGE